MAFLDEQDIEKQLAQIIEEKTGTKPDEIDCPGDLVGKVGETMRCTLTAGTDELGLTVTVNGVEGTTVNFDVAVDES